MLGWYRRAKATKRGGMGGEESECLIVPPKRGNWAHVCIAVVRAFTAVSRVIFSWRIISTAPTAVLGMAIDCPGGWRRGHLC